MSAADLRQRLNDAERRANAFRDAWIALRQDVPHVGLFNRWEDAVAEASHRASTTGYRWHVRFEPNNRWWQITESGRLDWWHQMREATS